VPFSFQLHGQSDQQAWKAHITSCGASDPAGHRVLADVPLPEPLRVSEAGACSRLRYSAGAARFRKLVLAFASGFGNTITECFQLKKIPFKKSNY